MRKILPILLILFAASCSTTAMLQEGELRLAENKVVVTNDKSYNASSLQPYIKQKASSWHPFMYVYNWQNGNDGGWDNFCRKLGQPPVVFDSSMVDASIASMLNHLEQEGYYYSKVDPVQTVNDKNVKVEYDVTLGKRFSVNDIDFNVRDSSLAAIMAGDSANFTISRGDFLSEQALEAESERLAQLFRNNGYWGFSKNYFFYYADTTRVEDHADLIVKIEEYTRNEAPSAAKPHVKYHLGNVSLTPQQGLNVRPSFLHNINQLQPGDLYREEDINRVYQRFSSVPLFSSVNMMLRPSRSDSSAVDCNIYLSPAKLQSIKLDLEGSFNSTGLLGVAPSLSYSHRNAFGGGEVFTLGFRGNFQFMFNDPTHASEFSVSSGLNIPWYPSFIWKLQNINMPKMDINAAFSYQYRPEYTRYVMSGKYGFSWNVGKRLYWQINPVQLSYVNTAKMSEDFFRKLTDPYIANSFKSHLDIGGGGMIYYTTNSTVNPKETYFYTRFLFDVSGNLINLIDWRSTDTYLDANYIFGVPYSQYARGELQTVETLRFGRENQFALACRLLAGAGYAYGNSFSMPFEKLFYAGGANSLRGWHARSVGPGSAPRDTSFAIANQTGDVHLEANVEFRFPLFWKLQGAAFLDAGNIWNLEGNYDDQEGRDPRSLLKFKDLFATSALDWGLGARLDFGLILIRVDVGFKTYDPRQQKWLGVEDWFSKDGYAFHFGIGYPF